MSKLCELPPYISPPFTNRVSIPKTSYTLIFVELFNSIVTSIDAGLGYINGFHIIWWRRPSTFNCFQRSFQYCWNAHYPDIIKYLILIAYFNHWFYTNLFSATGDSICSKHLRGGMVNYSNQIIQMLHHLTCSRPLNNHYPLYWC